MRKGKRTVLWMACALVLSFMLCSPVQAADYIPRVDNFILLADTSGSMGHEHGSTGSSRVALEKEMFGLMNTMIPALPYNGSLYSVVPFRALSAPAPYSQAALASGISAIPTDVLTAGFIGNPTPLGSALKKLDPVLADLSGRTAIIVASDGDYNVGPDPVSVARTLYGKYDVCIHTISYAEKPAGRKVLAAINALNECSISADGRTLLNSADMEGFVRQVFYDIAPARDSDGDGVIDDLDQCPGTPAGVAVDEKGCPLDSDGDGVYDYQDKCPGTSSDLAVDADGCPIPVTFTLDIEFDFDRYSIRPQYHEELAEVADFIKTHPDTNGQVQGHTDSRGTEKYNQALSEKRANVVKEYLVNTFGIDPSRLDARGFGESRPIADNKTDEGRQRNRRTEVVLTGDMGR
jgi:OOP family OmpA-OmpF porin